MSELVFLPADRLAEMIADRTVAAVEVLDAYLFKNDPIHFEISSDRLPPF
jgi:hypothetical protein